MTVKTVSSIRTFVRFLQYFCQIFTLVLNMLAVNLSSLFSEILLFTLWGWNTHIKENPFVIDAFAEYLIAGVWYQEHQI